MDTVSVSCEIAFCQFVSNEPGFSGEKEDLPLHFLLFFLPNGSM